MTVTQIKGEKIVEKLEVTARLFTCVEKACSSSLATLAILWQSNACALARMLGDHQHTVNPATHKFEG